LPISTEPLAQADGLRQHHLLYCQNHIVAGFYRLAIANLSAMGDGTTHHIKYWMHLVERFLCSAHHKGEGPGFRSSSTTRDGSINELGTPVVDALSNLTGILHGNSGGVDVNLGCGISIQQLPQHLFD